MKRLKVTKVLCVGTPRLHEAVLGQLAPGVQSLLLDVDCRYVGLLNSYSFFLRLCSILPPPTSDTTCSTDTFTRREGRRRAGR